ncbi:hydrolase [Lysobacter daejeonensis GH1-9]|uniref:Hydrolase n=1 Tax=Lysobacter daejeonensis GH1-9 TaxID=1385517 RepID=A0A0A0ETC4_9GAMM|nr:HAD family phosphatase [Lysobacter daejeonensis]KGM53343.1 hydrolase [Lysobacter daejeonensis GH1-9]
MSLPVLPFVPEAVIFDMDGLLLDSERVIIACLAQAAGEQGHELPHALWLDMVGNSEANRDAALDDAIGAEQRKRVLARARGLYAAAIDNGIPHRPGVINLIDLLRAHDIPRAVATSTQRAMALRKLQTAGLLRHFDAVCSSSDVAHAKPAPDVYLLAAASLGVAPARCLALEDSPTGVRAALAAGMHVLQVPDLIAAGGAMRASRHVIIGSLDDARRMLELRLLA